MGLFRKATRTAGRVAKNVAKEAVFGDLDLDDGKDSKKRHSRKGGAKAARERREYEEYQRLKEKFEPKDDATMRAEWERYYEESCEGDCETCPYYDWCPDEPEEEEIEEAPADEIADESCASDEAEDAAIDESEPEVELTEEEKAAKAAAEAFYEAGCDGVCETCEHYDWCPAEEEGDPDDKVVMMGMTQGEMKDMAKGSVQLAREGAMAAKELKEAMDDIMGGLDLKRYLK
ncbi:MAG: hypothetical protein Q4B69_01910 [Slackia sp.]|nr:hypothetical protein [Slackia sp.]